MGQLWSAVIAAVVSLIVAGGGWILQSRRFRMEQEEAARQRDFELVKLNEKFEMQRRVAKDDADARVAAERRETAKANIRFILKELPTKKFRTLTAIRRRLGDSYGDAELRELLRDAGALESQTNTGGDSDSFFLPDREWEN